jgi:hypothetical protein
LTSIRIEEEEEEDKNNKYDSHDYILNDPITPKNSDMDEVDIKRKNKIQNINNATTSQFINLNNFIKFKIDSNKINENKKKR